MVRKLAKKEDSSAPTDVFKKCTRCFHCWRTREDFLRDPELKIIGYQANLVTLNMGTFLFNHSCGTTLSVRAREFTDLYHGPAYNEQYTASEQCQGFCMDRSNLQPCPVHCKCAYVREIAFIIKSWRKRPHSTSKKPL